MITFSCKFYHAHADGEKIILEVDEATPASLLPKLLTKAEVAERLSISIRKIEALVAAHRLQIVKLDGCVRFKENDVVSFIKESQTDSTAPDPIPDAFRSKPEPNTPSHQNPLPSPPLKFRI